MPTVPVNELTHFCEAILEGAGVPRHKAEVAAACLISANLRGVDSHGIQLLPFYIDQLLAGEMDAQADGRVISESGCCLHFDGQNALGQWVAETCCAHAVRIARQQGLATGGGARNRTISARRPGGRRRCAPPGRSAS